MINHFQESEIPYGTLERFGLTQEMIEDLPVDVLQNICKFIDEILVIIIRQEWMHEVYSVLCNHFVHIVCNDLRVSCNDWTIVVVRLFRIFYTLIVDAWIEDESGVICSMPSMYPFMAPVACIIPLSSRLKYPLVR